MWCLVIGTVTSHHNGGQINSYGSSVSVTMQLLSNLEAYTLETLENFLFVLAFPDELFMAHTFLATVWL